MDESDESGNSSINYKVKCAIIFLYRKMYVYVNVYDNVYVYACSWRSHRSVSSEYNYTLASLHGVLKFSI